MHLNVRRHPTSESFLDHAQAWLMRAEVQNNLVLGIATAVVRNPASVKDPPYFATVHEDTGIVGCAVRTPPYPLAITHCEQVGALKPLARDVFALYPDLHMVRGPESVVGPFANLWAALTGGEVRRGMRQRLYEVRRVNRLDSPRQGRLRPATESDLEILTLWAAGFVNEVGVPESTSATDLVQDRLQNGRLFVWDDAGPVSMAAWTGKTPNGVRVNLVYTPEGFRRRGYATACVAALTQLLLDQGNKYCCLHADLANPTSNRIYQRIGYSEVCDVSQYHLA
jgi:uncharacterized protein